MKNTLQNAIKISAVAIALACSSASYAETTTPQYNVTTVSGSQIIDAKAKLFKGSARQSTALYEMSTPSLSEQFFAYCIEPAINVGQHAVYEAHDYNATVKTSVKALYEVAYADTLLNIGTDAAKAKQMVFQLALWELNNDDSNLFSGTQAFTANLNPQVEAAQALINSLSTYKLKNLYSYTNFTGVDSVTNLKSQTMLGVTAITPVPEVGTWAMMAAGLGLVGMMGRRRRNEDAINDEKFA